MVFQHFHTLRYPVFKLNQNLNELKPFLYFQNLWDFKIILYLLLKTQLVENYKGLFNKA